MANRAKRSIKLLAIFTVLCLSAAFCSLTAVAAEKYLSSEGTHIDITLTSDGTAYVEETWNYYYGGDTISRMGRVYLGGAYTLTDFEVYLDGYELTVLDAPDDAHPLGYAAVYEQEDGSTKVDTYLDAFEDSHQITIKYVVLDAVTVYHDVADFKWNLTSNAEPAWISELTASIQIPYGTEDGGLLLWAHGPSGGTFQPIVDDDGMVSELELSVSDVPDTMAVAVRLAMPPELFQEAFHTVDEDKLSEIIQYERQYERQHETSSGSKELENKLLIGAIVPAAIGLLLLPVSAALNAPVTKRRLKKLRHQAGNAPQYYRTLPDQLSPVLVRRLVMIYPHESQPTAAEADGQFSVTLLDLVERGFIRANMSQGSVVFSLNQVDREGIAEYESDVIEILEAASQGQPEFSLEQVNDYLKHNINWISEKKKAFNAHVDEAWNALGLEEEPNVKSFSARKLFLGCILGGFVIVGILALINRNSLQFAGNAAFFAKAGIAYAITMVFFALGVNVILSIAKDPIPVLTERGEQQYALWQAFSRFLDDLSTFEERELPDVTVWRKYLVYAAALGRSKKLMKQLQIQYPAIHEAVDNYDDWYYQMLESQIVYGMDRSGGFSLPTGDYDGGSGGDFSSDNDGYDSGSGGGDFD